MGKAGTAIMIAALGAAVPVAAAVQATGIDATLERTTKLYRDKGYSPAGWQKAGQLANATDLREPIALKGGRSYQIIAVCERKCTDLDLQLFDAAGKEVDWDATEDAVPVVATYAQTSQTYTLRIVMSACGQGPCSFGAMAFIKDQK